jgi:AAT family amino acid transporter
MIQTTWSNIFCKEQTMDTNENKADFGTGYLDKRVLVPRWRGPIPALVNLVLISILFYASWWIFMDPRGLMRMYTPYVGYMYSRWLLVTLIWVVYIFAFWPFKKAWLVKTHPVVKGIILTAFTWLILMVLIKGLFHGFLGHLSMAYFSPEQLEKIGITDFYAWEYSSQAIVMFAAIASWLSPAWVVAMEEAPWQNMTQPSRGFSIWITTFFFSTLIYFVTMHPHMGILYYPWQYFTSIAPPWWEHFADTVSGNFSIGWVMCCTVVVWIYETIWERYPFCLIRNDSLRRLSSFFGIILISLALAALLYFGQELIWGAAIRGTRREFAPDWRWLHVGEMAIFWMLPALWIKFFHNNAVNRFSTPVNALIRTIISVVAAVALYWLYYKTAHLFLGVQKGFSHPQQFPMIPTIWFICMMLINYWFMDGWPGWSMAKESISKTVVATEKARSEVKWSPTIGVSLVIGAIVGVGLYFVLIYALPTLGDWLTIYTK